MHHRILLGLGIAAALASAALPAAAQLDSVRLVGPEAMAPAGVAPLDAWFPRSVESRQPPFFEGGAYTRTGYMPLERAEELWRICASVPPTSFDYFDVLAKGLEAEARRQGVLLRLLELEDFDIEAQVAQVEQCLEDEADALIVIALEREAFDPVFRQAQDRGVPVIDLTTGSGSRHVTARVVTDRVAVGRAAGQFLADRHPLGGDVANVVWLPGPAGSRTAQEEDLGFRAAVRSRSRSSARISSRTCMNTDAGSRSIPASAGMSSSATYSGRAAASVWGVNCQMRWPSAVSTGPISIRPSGWTKWV